MLKPPGAPGSDRAFFNIFGEAEQGQPLAHVILFRAHQPLPDTCAEIHCQRNCVTGKVEINKRRARPASHIAKTSAHTDNYAARLVLFTSFPSIAFWLPTLTLICFGLASAFLASWIFKIPLS